MNAPARILIVKVSAIGDVLLSTPVAEALRKSFPNAHIGWVVEDFAYPILRGNPNIDKIHIWKRKERYKTLPSLIKEIRAENYDTALDLQGLFKSALVARLSGAKRRIGPQEGGEGSRLFYSQIAPTQSADTHVILRYLMRAKEIGAEWKEEPQMLMSFTADELEHVNKVLAENGAKTDDKLIALNPSAGKVFKQWPAEHFGRLGDLLIESGFRPVLTGAPADAELGNRVLGSMKAANQMVNFVGQTTLNQLGALFSRCELFIGGDTGPMHMAQASGTRVIALFGPTDPVILGPRHAKHRTLYEGLTGLASITPERVMNTVLEMVS